MTFEFLMTRLSGTDVWYKTFKVNRKMRLAYTLAPPTILDNLIAEQRILPVMALLIGNAPGGRDREPPCNPEFSRALVKAWHARRWPGCVAR